MKDTIEQLRSVYVDLEDMAIKINQAVIGQSTTKAQAYFALGNTLANIRRIQQEISNTIHPAQD